MSKIRQHETLRVPQGWTGQDKGLVIQLERILTDLYRLSGILEDSMVTAVAYDASTHKLEATINGVQVAIIGLASQSADGFMSSGDKTKLDGIEEHANNYSLPLAANGTRGGVQTGYSETGQKYALKLDSEKGYVEVPWVDTKNTAGGKHKNDTKMYLIAAENQSTNPQTNTNDDCYIGTDNCLYSNGSKVLDYAHLYNGLDFNTAGQKALDACNGYILSQTINAVRKGLLKVAVKSGADWILSSGTDAAIGDFLSVNGTLGKATAAITGGVTALVKNTNWEEVPGGILNLLQANKAEKSATVSSVDYDSGNTKITKTVNGTTTDVVSVSTIKGALGAFTHDQLAGR